MLTLKKTCGKRIIVRLFVKFVVFWKFWERGVLTLITHAAFSELLLKFYAFNAIVCI